MNPAQLSQKAIGFATSDLVSSEGAKAQPLIDTRRSASRQLQLGQIGHEEKVFLEIPWGPLCDVIFDPRQVGATFGMLVTLYAVAATGGRVAIASGRVQGGPNAYGVGFEAYPLLVSGGAGCDHYVATIRANELVANSPPGVVVPPFHFFEDDHEQENLITSIAYITGVSYVASARGSAGGAAAPAPVGPTFSLPAATVANSVLHIPIVGAAYAAPVNQDELAAAFSVSMAPNGRTFDVGQSLVRPTFTASYTSLPLVTGMLTDNAGTASKDIHVATTTDPQAPTAFCSEGTFTRATPGSITWTTTANAGGGTHSGQVSAYWYFRSHYGVLTASQLAASDSALAASLNALTSPLAGGRNGSYNIVPGPNDYGVFAFPEAFGSPTFQLTNSQGTFLPGGVSKIKSNFPIVNAYGITVPCGVYQVGAAGLGGSWAVT